MLSLCMGDPQVQEVFVRVRVHPRNGPTAIKTFGTFVATIQVSHRSDSRAVKCDRILFEQIVRFALLESTSTFLEWWRMSHISMNVCGGILGE